MRHPPHNRDSAAFGLRPPSSRQLVRQCRPGLCAPQLIGGVQASLLAILVYTDAITIEWLLALTLLLGITNSFAQPSRMALISNLVDRPALPSALAINSIVFNSARFIGPAIAGIVIAQVSVGAAFALN